MVSVMESDGRQMSLSERLLWGLPMVFADHKEQSREGGREKMELL